MNSDPVRVASIGMGWWSDVLATAAQRTNGKIEIVACFTRSKEKRQAFRYAPLPGPAGCRVQ